MKQLPKVATADNNALRKLEYSLRYSEVGSKYWLAIPVKLFKGPECGET